MRAMRRRKRIVDEDVAQRRHALGQLRVVLFLARMEAGVLEHQDRTVGRIVDGFARRLLDPNAVIEPEAPVKRGPLPLGLQRLASMW